jgi:hypothetical protein
VDGEPIESASLFDFGLYSLPPSASGADRARQRAIFSICQDGNAIGKRVSGHDVFFIYCTKIRSAFPRGCPSAPLVLIETILAAFEMEEILYRTAQNTRQD